MTEGMIFKALSGFYYVDDGASVTTCRGRGRLRHQKVTPLVGDRVVFTPHGDGTGSLDEILPRKNEFYRPAVANVDQLVDVGHGWALELILPGQDLVQGAGTVREAGEPHPVPHQGGDFFMAEFAPGPAGHQVPFPVVHVIETAEGFADQSGPVANPSFHSPVSKSTSML